MLTKFTCHLNENKITLITKILKKILFYLISLRKSAPMAFSKAAGNVLSCDVTEASPTPSQH